MKFLLLLALAGVVWWAWSTRSAGRPREPQLRRPPAPEKMVTCARCGVHLPESEAVLANGRIYCCEAHRAEAQEMER